MTLHTINCAESVGNRAVIRAHWASLMELIWGNSWCRSEVLEEGDQEDEEFHSGQTLSRTRPTTCKRGGFNFMSTMQPAENGRKASRLTNFLSILQKVWRIKGVRVFPFSLIKQDRSHGNRSSVLHIIYMQHTVASAQCQFKPHDVTLLGCQRHLKLWLLSIRVWTFWRWLRTTDHHEF